MEKIKNQVKKRAVESVETPAQLLSTALAGTSTAVQGQIRPDAMRKIVQRKRHNFQFVPPSPLDLKSLVLPESYTQYRISDDETILFLLGDTGNDDESRILLFGREDAKEWSHLIKKIYIDGTFKLAPPLFEQVFVILVERERFVFPVLYALLPNKRETTYCSLFRLIKTIWPNFEPESVSVDYEMAIINAVTEHFPTVAIRGCLFHLAQNIKRKLGREHLLAKYNRDADFTLKARMIVALAFVPMDHLKDVVQTLYSQLPELCMLYWSGLR